MHPRVRSLASRTKTIIAPMVAIGSTIGAMLAFTALVRAQGSDDCANPQPIFGSGSFAVDNTAATTSPPPASA